MPPFLAQLTGKKGVDLLSAPRVTTRSKQRAVIEIIREVRYPTEWKEAAEKKGGWVPAAFEVRNVGVTLEAEPVMGEGNTLDLQLTPQVVEYLGSVDVDTGKPIPAGPLARGEKPGVPEAAGRRLRAVFSSRKANASVSVYSGNSVVFSGLDEAETIKPFKPKHADHRLIVIVTARKLGADGTEIK